MMMKRLMGRYATRETELDELLRGNPVTVVGVSDQVAGQIAYVGADAATRFQFVVMAVLGLALLGFFIGGISGFDADQLKVAEVNLALGTLYLRELLDRNGGSLAPALISYNAGPHRYARWREFPEFSADAELMVERIPFRETRIYVKTITAYRHIYRRLYDLGSMPVDGPPIDG